MSELSMSIHCAVLQNSNFFPWVKPASEVNWPLPFHYFFTFILLMLYMKLYMKINMSHIYIVLHSSHWSRVLTHHESLVLTMVFGDTKFFHVFFFYYPRITRWEVICVSQENVFQSSSAWKVIHIKYLFTFCHLFFKYKTLGSSLRREIFVVVSYF